MFGALGQARSGEASLRRAERALREDRPVEARAALGRAEEAFARAETRLASPFVVPARLVPVASRQIRAFRALARAGGLVAEAGTGAVEALEARPPDGWRVRGGALDLDALRRAAGAVQGAIPAAEEAREILEASPRTRLVGPVARVRADALERVTDAAEGARRAAAGLKVAPALLGSDGPRRYYLSLGNLAEMRGGAFMGQYSLMAAEDGRIRHVEGSGRPTEDLVPPRDLELDAPDWYREAYGRYGALRLWQNINMSTDFPTVGSILVQAVEPEFGEVDGAVAIDPIGLAAILRLVGPVEVPGWPEPITAANVSRVTQFEAEIRFAEDNEARRAFLGLLIETVFAAIAERDLEVAPRSMEALGRAVRGGHIQMYAADPDLQEGLVASGLGRAVERAYDATDVLGVVNHNATGNKADWFLRRRIRYEVGFDPEAGTATTRLHARFASSLPSDDLPSRVIGAADRAVPPGVNRQLVVLLRPPEDELHTIRVEGAQAPASRDRESELLAYHTMVHVPLEGSAVLDADLVVGQGLEGSGRHRRYRLHVLRQPFAHPDHLEVDIAAPPGWRLAGATGFSGPLTEDVVLEVELTHTLRAWVLEHAVLRPFRVARRLLPGG